MDGKSVTRPSEVRLSHPKVAKKISNLWMDTKQGDRIMDKYVCTICGYVYDPKEGDPDGGIDPGTKFEAIPGDWVCPICGAAKDEFKKE